MTTFFLIAFMAAITSLSIVIAIVPLYLCYWRKEDLTRRRAVGSSPGS